MQIKVEIRRDNSTLIQQVGFSLRTPNTYTFPPGSEPIEEGTRLLGFSIYPIWADSIPPRTLQEQSLILLSFLRTLDPRITGFKVIERNDETEEWKCETYYDTGEKGEAIGIGNRVISIKGGSPILDSREALEKAEIEDQYKPRDL